MGIRWNAAFGLFGKLMKQISEIVYNMNKKIYEISYEEIQEKLLEEEENDPDDIDWAEMYNIDPYQELDFNEEED